MPTYDYKCPKCGKIDEIYCSHEEMPDLYHCENVPMIRQISKPSIHFKGTGFYETDYKGK